jgi:hypothetical protein
MVYLDIPVLLVHLVECGVILHAARSKRSGAEALHVNRTAHGVVFGTVAGVIWLRETTFGLIWRARECASKMREG